MAKLKRFFDRFNFKKSQGFNRKIKFSVHPLFLVLGIYFAVTGKVFSFLVFTLTALIHELGHSLTAESLGYRLNKIVLLPYGAIVSGETQDMPNIDQIKTAAAGPLVNIVTAIFFVCLWWLVPQIYPYTELAVVASLTLATINLLPAYPLDGGRVLLACLSLYMSQKSAYKLVKRISIGIALCVFGLFIYSLFNTPNVSLLFFSLFIITGNLKRKDGAHYVLIAGLYSFKGIKRGKRVKTIGISASSTIKELLSNFSSGELLECIVFSDDLKVYKRLSPDKVIHLLQSAPINMRVKDAINSYL